MNARPNNNKLITYYLPVCYLLRIQQYPVNTTYNIMVNFGFLGGSYVFFGLNGCFNQHHFELSFFNGISIKK